MAREFAISIYDSMSKGLAPEYSTNRALGYLEKAKNIRVTKTGGIEPYIPTILPFEQALLDSHGIEYNWPYPYMLKGKKYTWLCLDTDIFIVNEEDWSLLHLDDIEDYNGVVQNEKIIRGTRWQLVDFWDTWFLHNGKCTIFETGLNSLLGNDSKIHVNSHIGINAGCAHRGRRWLGGFDSDNFYTENRAPGYMKASANPRSKYNWKNFWDDLIDSAQGAPADMGVGLKFSELKSNWAMWSTIGGGDLLYLFNYDLMRKGVTGVDYAANTVHDDNYIFQILQQNTWGMAPMSWQGDILSVSPLGKAVIYAGTGGVTALIPVGDKVGVKEFPKLSQGIFTSGCVGGDEEQLLIMDSSGMLWLINEELQVQRVGYENILGSMAGTDVVITYDNNDRNFYICNHEQSYILTSQGLTSHTQRVTCIVNTSGGALSLGVIEQLDESMEILTEPFDMGTAGLKTIVQVEVIRSIEEWAITQGTPHIDISILFRNSSRDYWKETEKRKLNNNDNVRIPITAKEFKLRITSDNFADTKIENVIIKYQASDKRFTRGINMQEVQ